MIDEEIKIKVKINMNKVDIVIDIEVKSISVCKIKQYSNSVAMVEMIMWSKEILIMEVALIDVLDVK